MFIDHGMFHITRVPPGYQIIKVHLVFAVKHDGRHKARMVADGHLTQVPLNSVYAGVVSLRGFRLCLFLGELNNMEAYATDMALHTWKVPPRKRFASEPDLNSDHWQDIYSLFTRHCTD